MTRIKLFLPLAIVLIWACNNTKNIGSQPVQSIVLDIKITDTITGLDTLRLFAWNAIQAEEVQKQVVTKAEGGYTCKMNLTKLPRGMYYVGASLRDLKPLLLGTEKLVALTGGSAKMGDLQIGTSDLNKQYEAFLKTIQQKNQDFMTLITEYNANKGDAALQESIKKKMATEDAFKMKMLDSLRKKNSELTRIMAFNAFQSYQNNGVSGQTEGTYFAHSYLKFVDFKDSVYVRLPFYYENIKNYTGALTQVGLKIDEQKAAIDSLFAKVSVDNPLYKPTIVGVMFGMMGKNNDVFLKYAQLYLEKYKGQYVMLDNFINEQVLKLKGAAGTGEEAAAIKGATPDGNIFELKNLRGKYVLIDFWASWCGPCRRENPSVVALYNKYKDKGFDILGVSLDTDGTKWKEAIAADKLTWNHVSDLKGWSSELSKPYGVRGIPHTVLIDKEGKIIAEKLRGGALESKLAEIFGH